MEKYKLEEKLKQTLIDKSELEASNIFLNE